METKLINKMENPKYSIIIPHKNSPDLLLRCINSIPDNPNIQVIVVDDDSDNEKVDFDRFPGYDRNNVDLIFLKESLGAGHARNVGLTYAKGEWLLFADADDYYEKNFIDVIDKYVNKGLDILFFNIRTYYNETKYDKYFSGEGSEDDVRLLWFPWNKVFSKKLIFENSITFDEIPVGNDAMFCLKANFKAKSILIIKEKLYFYTDDNTNSISLRKKNFNRIMDYLRINIRINNYLRENNKQNYGCMIFAPKILYNIFKEYGFRCLNTYIFHIIRNGSIIKEILFWIRNRRWKYKYN